MRKGVGVVCFAALVLILAFVGQAFDIAAGIGSSGILAITGELDISANFSIRASFGVRALPIEPQTPAYAIAFTAKYWPFTKRPQFAPYVGASGDIELRGFQMRPVLGAMVGARYYLTSRFFGHGEVAFFLPILDIAAWYSEIFLGIGYRF